MNHIRLKSIQQLIHVFFYGYFCAVFIQTVHSIGRKRKLPKKNMVYAIYIFMPDRGAKTCSVISKFSPGRTDNCPDLMASSHKRHHLMMNKNRRRI